ncbi:MAG: Mur ligase domain-containing protein, partial [Candidatus Puniceispirillaceae bacterium]
MSLSALNPVRIAEICGGYWLNDILPDFVLTHTVIDSRKMAKNTLFVALKGSRTDGHIFL